MNPKTFRCVRYSPPHPPLATIFFISSFKSKVWVYKQAIQQLVDFGFQVYAYDYYWKPLQNASYPHEWLEFSSQISQHIADNMEEARLADPRARFAVMGVSIGSTIALYAAKNLPELERIVLITSYGSMAKHIWEHPLLQNMRNKCADFNIDLRQTRQILGNYEPASNLHQIGSRKILLFVNESDPVIPYANTKILIDEAKKAGVHLICRPIAANRHSVTIFKAFQRPGLWLSFLASLRYPQEVIVEPDSRQIKNQPVKKIHHATYSKKI